MSLSVCLSVCLSACVCIYISVCTCGDLFLSRVCWMMFSTESMTSSRPADASTCFSIENCSNHFSIIGHSSLNFASLTTQQQQPYSSDAKLQLHITITTQLDYFQFLLPPRYSQVRLSDLLYECFCSCSGSLTKIFSLISVLVKLLLCCVWVCTCVRVCASLPAMIF